MKTCVLKTEEDFTDYCPCSCKILELAESMKTDAMWFFDSCYSNYIRHSYFVTFKSYVTDEYKDYILTIQAIKIDDEWDIKVIKKVDNLLNEIATR